MDNVKSGDQVSAISEATRIDAVIFDLDGVIIESEQWWDEVRSGLAREQGQHWPAQATRAMQGMSTPEWATYLSQTVGLGGTPAEIAEQVIGRMAQRYSAELPAIPGAPETVRDIARHWPVGVASSSPRLLIDTVLTELDLSDVVTATRSTEEVDAGKPSPSVYLKVCELLAANPARTIGVEDSTNGLRSAAAAGLIVVAVPNPTYPPAPDALALADLTLGHLRELTPDAVRALAQ